MRVRVLIPAAAVAFLAMPAAASAMFAHVVAPGETLTSVAAADGLTIDQLAAANGLSPTAQLIAGTILLIPPQTAPASAVATMTASGTVAEDPDGDSDDPAVTAPTEAAPTPQGDGDADGDDPPGSTSAAAPATVSYVVQPGDTLTAIAARAGTTVAGLAAANGLDPNAPLLIGTVLRLSGAGAVPVSLSTSQPVGAAAEGNPNDPPYPTPERLSASQIGQIAATNGVPASLADAVAWQESGFNNDLTSSADARGIMQILPGTWSWIQSNLVAGAPPLAPASATDNVRGGALLLRWLLNNTGGDPAMAAAGYYQGLPSVQRNGLFPSTQQYVNDVMSLRRQFGGG